MIKTENDHKEKRQSWSATIDEISGGDGTGHYNCYFQGYAATEHQAKLNVIQQVDNMIKNLKRIKDEIEV